MDTAIVIAALGVIYLSVIAKQGTVAVVRCVKSSSANVAIPLTCNNNQMIHVIRESYSKESSERTCLIASNDCAKVLNTDAEGLVVNCNGQQTCNKVLLAPPRCTPLAAFEIEYECVARSIDICNTSHHSTSGLLYLHSPGFPDSAGDSGSCNCQITGSAMNVTVLEHHAKGQVLNISSDNAEIWSSPSILSTQYNAQVKQGAEQVAVSYANNNTTKENVWIRITGTGKMYVTCWSGNEGTPSSHLGSRSTESHVIETVAQHQTTVTSYASENEIPAPSFPILVIAGSAGGGVVLIVLVAVTVVLYRWKNKSKEDTSAAYTDSFKMCSLPRTSRSMKPNNQFEVGNYRDPTYTNGSADNESSTDVVQPGSELCHQADAGVRYKSRYLPKQPHEADRTKHKVQGNKGDRDEGMYINDLFHSYQPGSGSGSRDEGQESHGSAECNLQTHMVDNDLYHHIVTSRRDLIKEEPVVGNYHEIKDVDLCVSPAAKCSVLKERSSAYDELKLHTQRNWVKEEPVVENYEEIKDEDLCVSHEATRPSLTPRPAAYDELKLPTFNR